MTNWFLTALSILDRIVQATRRTSVVSKLARTTATALLLVFLATGARAAFPPVATAIPCGAGEDPCSATESDGYDRFCIDAWWFFKLCFEVYYYHLPEQGDDGEEDDGEEDEGGGGRT